MPLEEKLSENIDEKRRTRVCVCVCRQDLLLKIFTSLVMSDDVFVRYKKITHAADGLERGTNN